MINAKEMLKISNESKKRIQKEEKQIVKSELAELNSKKDRILEEIERHVRREAIRGFTNSIIPICMIPTLYEYIENSKIIVELIKEKLSNWLNKEGFRSIYICDRCGQISEIQIYWGDNL